MEWMFYQKEPACEVMDRCGNHFAVVIVETEYVAWYVFRKADGWPVSSGLHEGLVDLCKLSAERALVEADDNAEA